MSNDAESNKVYLEEYKSLRDETLKRIEISQTVINLNFVAIGGLLLFGNEAKCFDLVLLLYPFLSWGFAKTYASNQMVIADIGNYIREGLETKVCDLRWATYFDTRNAHSTKPHNFFVIMVFVLASLFSVLLSFLLIYYGAEKTLLKNNWIWWSVATLDGIVIWRIYDCLKKYFDYHPHQIHADLIKVDLKKFFMSNERDADLEDFNFLLDREGNFIRKNSSKNALALEFNIKYEKLHKSLPEKQQVWMKNAFYTSEIKIYIESEAAQTLNK